MRTPGAKVGARLLTEKGTGRSRGIAFVEFDNEEDAERALQLDYTLMGDRRIRVEKTAKGKGNNEGRKDAISKMKEEQSRVKKKSVDNAIRDALAAQVWANLPYLKNIPVHLMLLPQRFPMAQSSRALVFCREEEANTA